MCHKKPPHINKDDDDDDDDTAAILKGSSLSSKLMSSGTEILTRERILIDTGVKVDTKLISPFLSVKSHRKMRA